VKVHLEEGAFTIRPAPAGTSISVEGDYDRAVYDLKTELTRDSDGNPSYSISFLPKYSMLRRILSQGVIEIDDATNHLTIHIPRDLPIDLDMKISKAESRLFLGGLALTNARLDLSMGEHRIVADEPNPLEMGTLDLDVGMGEVRMEGIGLLRPGTINLAGGMGEVRLDLGREISRDTTVTARMRMGEMSIGLPRRARVDARSTVWLGEASGSARDARYDDDPDLPTLTIRGSVTMGELKYQRH